ncbi:MAG: fibronectin type III domain-containing protein, partial [Candidatus Poribacteria bacterium]|nr:fibronectin type III domain-containing protein [Candidatus Poribacteria bacterium]
MKVSLNRTFTCGSYLSLFILCFFLFVFSVRANEIDHLAISDLSSSSAVISWVSGQAEVGTVNYGSTAELGQTISAAEAKKVHRLELTGLLPAATYLFEVVSGSVTDDNDGNYYTFQTAQTASGTPYTLYGQVLDNTTPVNGGLVSVWVEREEADSSRLTTLTNSSGFWNLNLGNLKHVTTGIPFGYQNGDLIRVEVKLDHEEWWYGEAVVIGVSPQEVRTYYQPASGPQTITLNQPGISNYSSTSVVVNWSTNLPATSKVDYGQTTLGQTVEDNQLRRWHRVEITDLEPETVYLFQISSNYVTDDNSGDYYSFQTANTGTGTPYTVFGQVLAGDDTTAIPQASVTVSVTSGGNDSSLLTTITGDSGFWNVNLGNLKQPATGAVFSYLTTDQVTVSVELPS